MEDYDDLHSFIIDDEEYIEDKDIDENDKEYTNINWKEESYVLYSSSDTEERNIDDELLELKVDNEIYNKNLPKKDTFNNSTLYYNEKDMNISVSNINIEMENNNYQNVNVLINVNSLILFLLITFLYYLFYKNENNIYKKKQCGYCYQIITESDACISCSNCSNWEHIACTNIPYDNIENFPELDEYYCHLCRKLGIITFTIIIIIIFNHILIY